MAKNAALGDAIQKIIDNVEDAVASTSVALRDEMKKDFEKVARESVDKYYEYQNGGYTKRGRQYRLYNIYQVHATSRRKGDGYIVKTSLIFDSDTLEGVYKSHSKKHQGEGSWASGGNVEAEYVFKNFFAGEHPWTNGYPRTADTLEYRLIKGAEPSPRRTLDKYFENYERILNRHFNEILSRLLKSYL